MLKSWNNSIYLSAHGACLFTPVSRLAIDSTIYERLHHPMGTESILFCATQVATYWGHNYLTNATGFFFRRDEKLFLVTSRHVFFDEHSKHAPDRVVIKFHTDRSNSTRTIDYSIPLYLNGRSQWVSGSDRAGDIDVAVIHILKERLPREVVFEAFGPENLLAQDGTVEIGTPLLIVGFPLGFHDTLHNLPVVRSAINASSFALGFKEADIFSPTRERTGDQVAPPWCVEIMRQDLCPGVFWASILAGST